MKKDWQELFDQLEIIENDRFGTEIWTKEEIRSFENKNNIILPNDYIEFCQIFGTGIFGDYVSIHCPNIKISTLQIKPLKDEICRFFKTKNTKIIDVNERITKIVNTKYLNKFLDSAFIFGGTSCADIIFWDLLSDSESDNSYDIYLTNNDCFDGIIYKFGRDLYEFIQNFALGAKYYEILPKSMQISPEVPPVSSFTRYIPKW